MSCDRSFDIDLAAFLREPRAPGLAEFVEHYPRCPWCAAEVRAWTDVQLALEAAHPEPDVLLRHQDGRLGAPERETVARHVASCRTCGEELRTLERFAMLARESPARRAPHPARRESWARRLLRGSGRVLWHPAVAYGVLLLLLTPLAIEVGTGIWRPRGAALVRDQDSYSLHVPQDAAPAAPTAKTGPSRLAVPEGEKAPEASMTFTAAERAGGSLGADAGAHAPRQLVPRPDGNEQVLDIPLAGHEHGAAIEVRLRDATGTRELRQRFSGASGGRLTIRVPSVWLSPGRYEIEVGPVAGNEPIETFVLVVR